MNLKKRLNSIAKYNMIRCMRLLPSPRKKCRRSDKSKSFKIGTKMRLTEKINCNKCLEKKSAMTI